MLYISKLCIDKTCPKAYSGNRMLTPGGRFSMTIPVFFVAAVAGMLYLNIRIRKSKKESKTMMESYYERERQAHSTRRQSLDDLAYVHVELNRLPFDVLHTQEVLRYEKDVVRLSKMPMVSFKGLDNTELKIRYGIPNLNTLIQYETTYNLMLDAIVGWSKALIEAGFTYEAITLLEEGIRMESDKSENYILLLNLYKEHKKEALNDLGAIIKDRYIHRKEAVLHLYEQLHTIGY